MTKSKIGYYLSYSVPAVFLLFILFVLDINNQLAWLEYITEFVDLEPGTIHGIVIAFLVLVFSLLIILPFSKRVKHEQQVQRELAKKNFRFRHAVESLNELVIICDKHLTVVEANNATLDLSGLSHSSVVGHAVLDLPIWLEKEKDEILNAFEIALSLKKELDHLSVTLVSKKDNLFRYSLALRAIANPVTKEKNLVIMGHDVTKILRAEEELIKSKARLSNHLENTPLAVMEFGRKGLVESWNPAAQNIFRFAAQDVMGRSVVHKIFKDQKKFVNAWRACLVNQGSRKLRFENLTREKTPIICDWYLTPIYDKSGKVISMAALVQDVTEQVYSYEDLEDSEFRAVLVKEAVASIGSANTIQDAITSALNSISHYVKWPVVNAYLAENAHKNTFVCQNTWVNDEAAVFPEFVAQAQAYRMRLGQDLVGDILATGEYRWLVKLDEDMPLGRPAINQSFASGLIYPLYAWGQPMGVIELYSVTPHGDDDRIIELVEQICTQVTLAMERIESEQEREKSMHTLDQRMKESNFLYSALNIMFNAEFSVNDVMSVLVNMITTAMRYPHLACASIEVDGVEYRSHEWLKTDLLFTTSIKEQKKDIGRLVVCYRVHHQDGELFSSEELTIFDSLASQISAYIARKKTQEALEKAIVESQKANQAKSDFLATMSHEIRTPMNGIVGMIDLLQYTELDAEQNQMLSTVRDSTFSLLQIINDILDFSKIEAGKLELETTEFNLFEVVEGVVDVLSANASQKGINFLLSVDNQVPVVLLGDPVRVRQILFNLLGNAIKFTNSVDGKVGCVLLRITWQESSGLHLEVEDNGIGMSADVVDKLFKPFTQADSATTRKFGGTGLGLSICLHLVELMQGRIWVESKEGVGSTFLADIPLRQHAAAKLLTCTLTSPLRICMCFTKPEQARVLAHYLVDVSKEIHEFDDAKALQNHCEAAADKPDLIIIGHHWAWETRRQLVTDVLASSDCAQTKVLLLLRHGEHIDIEPNKRLGFLRASPMRKTQFYARLEKLFNQHSAALDNKAQTVVDGHPVDENPFDGVLLVAEDNETNQAVLRRQLTLLGYQADFANNGAEAFERWQQGHYAMLLSDMHMPEMDGVELTQAIRAEEARIGGHIPIIAITANAMKGEEEKYLAMGMDDYLSKPVELNLFKQKLAHWVGVLSQQADEPARTLQNDSSDANDSIGESLDQPVAESADALVVDELSMGESDAILDQAIDSLTDDDPLVVDASGVSEMPRLSDDMEARLAALDELPEDAETEVQLTEADGPVDAEQHDGVIDATTEVTADTTTKVSTSVAEPNAAPVVNVSALAEYVGDDSDMHREILTQFIAPSLDSLQEIHNAVAQQDAKQAGELGHKLKSAARLIGADYLADLCFELEQAGKQADTAQITQLAPKIDQAMQAVVDFIRDYIA